MSFERAMERGPSQGVRTRFSFRAAVPHGREHRHQPRRDDARETAAMEPPPFLAGPRGERGRRGAVPPRGLALELGTRRRDWRKKDGSVVAAVSTWPDAEPVTRAERAGGPRRQRAATVQLLGV